MMFNRSIVLSTFLIAAAALAQPAHAAFRFADGEDPLAAAKEGAPMALTASDGTGLVLVGLEAKAVIEGPLAFTELHLTFQNPLDRVLEGRFQITLPARASVSRFAMKTAKRWQEGEVIERERARRVYEDFLHRKQDPALLEQGEANEFGARVFPIPAKGKKELILSYAQHLADRDMPYVLPLKGLSRVGQLSVDVSGGAAPFSMNKRGFVPNADVEVPLSGTVHALRHDDLVAVRVQPVHSGSPAAVESLLFVVDTSASRALALERQVQLVKSLSRALVDGGAPKTKVGIVAFDQSSQVVFEGTADAVDRKVLRKLRQRRAMGASDLGQALTAIGRTVRGKYSRALLISDGVVTAGEKEAGALDKHVAALRSRGIKRMDAAVLGGLRDESRLRALITGSLAKDGAVIDADRGVRHVADKMMRTTRSKVALQIEGAEWTWPTEISGVQAGDDVLVFARLEKGVSGVRLRVDNKRAGQVAVQRVAKPLLERAVVEAEIARLTAARDALTGAKVTSERKRLKDVIVKLSTEHRVLSRFTSLLVLETAADYARYGITETALSDVLTVRNGALVVADRRALPPPPVKPQPIAKNEDKDKAKSNQKKKGKKSAKRAAKEEAKLVLSDEEEALSPEDADADDDEAMPAPAPAQPSSAVAAESESAPLAEPVLDEAEAPEVARDGRGGGGEPIRSFGRARSAAAPPPPPRARPRRARERRAVAQRAPAKLPPADAWTGKFADVMNALNAKKARKALTLAQSWREEEPGDVLALVALGRAFAATGDVGQAARAYGSLIDLFPARADLRRFAGNLLESLDDKRALVLASESYGEAVQQRRDHPAGWRLYAFALARLGRFDAAMTALEEGLAVPLPGGRFAGVPQILREDLSLIGAMRIRSKGKKVRKDTLARLKKVGATPETAPSVRFVLSWETDANDVDFHIYDAKGGHAYYGQRQLPSGGGTLYADVTTGYGPECFTVRKSKKTRPGPYRMRAHYYSRGPMGYGMGALQVIDNVGGNIAIQTKPFVVMKDSAYVDLGTVK